MRNQLFIGVAVAALMIPAAASAQETTSIIRGTVTKGDAPVVGATVVATDVNSGTRSSTTTSNDGAFSLPGLRVGGPYKVEVTSAEGNTSVTDIYTVVQQAYDLPINLDAGDSAGDIVVTAASIRGAGVTSDGPQTVLSAADIAKVASVNRDIRDIERRDPFASIDLSNGGARGGAVSFAGVNPRFNRFTINGVTVGDTFGLNQDASPTNRGPVPFDALAQVSVSVAPYDFRQGGFQGGAIDTVIKSGTNKFHGTGFYSQNTDGLSGSRIGTNLFTQPNFKSETYGVSLGGPIIRDRVFFFVSGERNTDPRPFSPQVQQIPGLTTGIIDNITSIAQSRYNVDAGEVLVINPRKDEKFTARIDVNITDKQKLSFTYVNAFDSLVSQNNTSTSTTTPAYGLSSNAYTLSELLRAGIVQLNSDWTSNISTEARLIYRTTTRGQEPLLGRPNGQFQVCNDATSTGSLTACSTGSPTIAFGPDNFRQTNSLFFDTWAGSLLTRVRLNSHELKLLTEFNQNRTFNNFVPNSLGSFYFDSLADYQAGRASRLQYAATTNGDPNGAAANFRYSQWTFGVQDDWSVTDTLKLSYGFRWDIYGQRGRPVLNQSFIDRNGFANTKTYDGQQIFQPRVSFNWKPVQSLKVRGGFGIFGGGSPDIYLSNSFSNTVTTNALDIRRSAAGANTCTGGISDAICQAALNNVTGQIPASLATFAQGTGGGVSLTNSGALAPNFKLPSSWKATLSADYKIFGINFGADYYFSAVRDAIIFTDGRSVQVGTLPDGRPRYNAVTSFSDNNYDIITGNTGLGRSHIGVVRFDKQFDFGLSLGGSYTLQDVRDVSSATSSTINSNYRFQIFADPNSPTLGTSDNQIKWSFKYNIGYDHAFFGDYRTVIQLFGETRAGRPYSFTFLENTGNRSSVFGTVLTNTGAATNLLYVPTSTSDPIVSYDSAATASALDALINSSALSNYRGKIAPKNIARSRAYTRIDLHLEQQIPTFLYGSRITLFADINNLPNLINRNWGGLRQLGFPATAAVVNVTCLSATGTALTGAIGSGTNPTGGCARYQYSTFRAPNDSVAVFDGSLYGIRLGVRLTF